MLFLNILLTIRQQVQNENDDNDDETGRHLTPSPSQKQQQEGLHVSAPGTYFIYLFHWSP